MLKIKTFLVYNAYEIVIFYKKCTKYLEFNFCFYLKLSKMSAIIRLYIYVLTILMYEFF